MSNACIYSIGYGARKLEEFISLLKMRSINYLIDVRSIPYSKTNQKFNRADLTYYLENDGIKYVFMGDLLGGRPDDKTCYNSEGKVDYSILKTKDFYKQGIQRLKTAHEKGLNIALMCSEANPSHCHRSKLIGASLIQDINKKICIMHIDEFGKVKDQASVMNEINKGRNHIDLFNEQNLITSRKSYIK